MQWQVLIPGDEREPGDATVQVDAENWMSALRLGLKQRGMNGQIFSNLSCNIRPDQTVEVRDFVTNRVFHLRPCGAEPAPFAAPAPVATRKDRPVDFGATPALAQDLPLHDVFYTRDEVPDDGSDICYRERLISIAPGQPREDAARLVQAYFHQARTMGGIDGTKLFISVQVFDHKFSEQSQRPAVAALTWKQWSPRAPKVIFPLSGAEAISVSVSESPAPISEPELSAHEANVAKAPPNAATVAPIDAPIGAPAAPPEPVLDLATPKPKVEGVTASKASTVTSRHSEPPTAKRPSVPPGYKVTRAMGIDDRMVVAFERMHEIYGIRDHDQAAQFVIALCHELVEAEAGSCMLISPGRYELYIAAATGTSKDVLLGRRISFTKGIVGFATRTSSVVSCSDPAGDPRFDQSFDTVSGFVTRNILVAPITFEGHTLGAIELINSPNTGGFTQDDANILSYIGGSFGEFIQTSLPSREADFSDKDFFPHGQAARTPAPAAGRPASVSAPVTKVGATPATTAKKESALATVAKPAPAHTAAASRPAPRPSNSPHHKGGKKKKSGKH